MNIGRKVNGARIIIEINDIDDETKTINGIKNKITEQDIEIEILSLKTYYSGMSCKIFIKIKGKNSKTIDSIIEFLENDGYVVSDKKSLVL